MLWGQGRYQGLHRASHERLANIFGLVVNYTVSLTGDIRSICRTASCCSRNYSVLRILRGRKCQSTLAIGSAIPVSTRYSGVAAAKALWFVVMLNVAFYGSSQHFHQIRQSRHTEAMIQLKDSITWFSLYLARGLPSPTCRISRRRARFSIAYHSLTPSARSWVPHRLGFCTWSGAGGRGQGSQVCQRF